jgi:hypothetical protein
MAGSLANGRPQITEHSGVQTLPEYREFATVTFTVVANAVRLQVSGITAIQIKKLLDQYVLADNGAETSEVRQVTGYEIVDGTPDTYFITVSEPFTVAAGAYDLLYVLPEDAEFSNTVIAGTEDVYIDGEPTLHAGETITFQPVEPFKPLVLFSDYPYRISNGFFFELGGGGSSVATPEIVEDLLLVNQSASIGATDLYSVLEDGFYQVGWNAEVTTAATSSSTLGQFQLRYTSPTDSVAKTSPTQNNVTASAGNTTGSCITGTFTVYAKAGTNIQYFMGYASSGATAMVYSLKMIVIKL